MSPLLALIPALAAAAVIKVPFVTADRVYLRAGSEDGLALGAALTLSRGKQALGTCTLDQVSAHRASCPFAGAAVGDVAAFRPAAAKTAVAPARKPAPRADAARVQAALAAAAPVPFDFAHGATTVAPRWRTLAATIEHTSYLPLSGRTIARERFDATLDGLALGWLGLTLSARATLFVYANGAGDLRLRPYEVGQIYVWQLELASREIGRPFALALGRVWPQFAPGLALVDGAQVGWKARDGSAEVGVVGGLVPDARRLYPSTTQYTVAAYYGHEVLRRGWLRAFRHSGRAGVRGVPSSSIVQIELEEAVSARIGNVADLSGQLRLTLRSDDAYKPRLELAIVRAAVRPVSALELSVDARLTGAMGADLDNFGTTYWVRGDRLSVTLDGFWRALSWLSVGLETGVAHDFGSQLGRQYLGPAAQLVGLASGRLGFQLGYREELGWTRGRYAYLQAVIALPPWIRVVARGSFADDALAASADPWREVGVFLHCEGAAVGWLRWYLQTSYRAAVTPSLGAPGMGLVLRAGLGGSF